MLLNFGIINSAQRHFSLLLYLFEQDLKATHLLILGLGLLLKLLISKSILIEVAMEGLYNTLLCIVLSSSTLKCLGYPAPSECQGPIGYPKLLRVLEVSTIYNNALYSPPRDFYESSLVCNELNMKA